MFDFHQKLNFLLKKLEFPKTNEQHTERQNIKFTRRRHFETVLTTVSRLV